MQNVTHSFHSNISLARRQEKKTTAFGIHVSISQCLSQLQHLQMLLQTEHRRRQERGYLLSCTFALCIAASKSEAGVSIKKNRLS